MLQNSSYVIHESWSRDVSRLAVLESEVLVLVHILDPLFLGLSLSLVSDLCLVY